MTDRISTNELRMWADGELPADAAARVDAFIHHDPRSAAEVDADHRLRASVARIMGAPTAPQELRNRIAVALQAGDVGETELKGRSQALTHGRAARGATPVHKPAWYAGFQRANIFAMAAVLAIVGGVIAFGIYMPSIDNLIGNGATQQVDLVEEAARWANERHGACSVKDKKSCDWPCMKSTHDGLMEWLGRDVTVPDLTSLGYEFQYARKCGVPGTNQSAHLVYMDTTNGDRGPKFSLFVAPDNGQFDGGLTPGMFPGTVYHCPKAAKAGIHEVLRCTDTQTVYFLICCRDSDLERLAQEVVRAIDNHRH